MSPCPRVSVSDVDDGALVQACIRGDSKAWDELVERFGPIVYDAARFTLRRVLGKAREEDIENVVQGVLTGLCDRDCRRLRLFQGRSTLKTWLTSVTARFGLNYIRTEKRKGSLKFRLLDESAGEFADRPVEEEFSADEREQLFDAIEQMPERDRLLLKLFYFDGLSYRSIAEVLRMPVNSVSPLLTRARDALKKKVEIP